MNSQILAALENLQDLQKEANEMASRLRQISQRAELSIEQIKLIGHGVQL